MASPFTEDPGVLALSDSYSFCIPFTLSNEAQDLTSCAVLEEPKTMRGKETSGTLLCDSERSCLSMRSLVGFSLR